MLEVLTVETSELGDRSYIAHDGKVAIVVDPQRDVDRLQAVLDEVGARVALVLETHLHNDYVSGGLTLATISGARYAVAAADEIAFDAVRVRDGDRIDVGDMVVEVVETPGHTDSHLAFIVRPTSQPDAPVVFSGGCLLYGSVGRTDLVDPARTDELTRAQFHSARRLAGILPDEAAVFPTHGFGSFCSSGNSSGESSSTIGHQKSVNDALVIDDEQAFVEQLVAGLTSYPRYYAHMGARNRAGADPMDLSPPAQADPAELARRISAGEWVVDLRSRTAFAARHLEGSVGIELGQQFATYLGWVIPWGTPVTLIGDSIDQVADAQRQLVRIGIDRPAAHATGRIDDLADGRPVGDYPCADFEQVAKVLDSPDLVVLDVRLDDERAEGAVRNSLHVPLQDLFDRLDELSGRQSWIYCATGFRASVAASLLDRAGLDVVLIDDDYTRAEELGLTIDGTAAS